VNVGNEDEQSPLLKILRLEAPAIDLIKPVTRIDLAEQIDLGRIDVAIGVFSDPPSRFRTSLLFEYDDVLIVGGKRKLGRIDNAALARMPLVVVSFGGEQEGAIGGFISERGLARRSEMYDRAALERALSESDRPPRIAVSHRISWPCPPCSRTPNSRRSFRVHWHAPSNARTRSRYTNCPMPQPRSRCGYCGTNASRASRRTTGFTMSSGARPRSSGGGGSI